MAGSLKGLSLNLLLLGGGITSSQLESELSTPSTLGAFRKMLSISSVRKQLLIDTSILNIIFNSEKALTTLLSDENALNLIGSSDTLVASITQSTAALKAIINSDSIFLAIKNNSTFYTKLQNRVNASSSKLKRQIFTTNGTFTIPGTGLAACTAFLQGGGGGITPAAASPNYGSGGGGGGETKVYKFTTMPTSNIAITVGLPSNPSILGSFATAAAGSTSVSVNAAFNGAAGGGITSGTIPISVDYSPLTAIYELGNYSVKGGGGGGGRSSNDDTNAVVGELGWSGTSALGVSSTGFGTGGSGGQASSGGQTPPTTATYGNGATSISGAHYSGAGSAGVVIVYYIEN